MHLAVDLRFYRPEPYGLAVHIRDLFAELVPMLGEESKFSKVTLIFCNQLDISDLSKNLSWWSRLEPESKFEVFFSASPYYSWQEQTLFISEIKSIRPDLIFFFNFNFPLLINIPFVYQVLDLTIPKTKPKSLRLLAAKFMLRAGLRKAKHRLFLGQATRQEAEEFSGLNFTNPRAKDYKPNTVVYNGINPKYLSQPASSLAHSRTIGLSSTKKQIQKARQLRESLEIHKDYFLFVSVWRSYKNVERLVEAFDEFNKQNGHQYQLVLGGRADPKHPEIWQRVQANSHFIRGDVLVPGSLTDEDLIALQDGALAYVFPSLSEGFGLTLIEAAVRGVPVLCSDIPVFREILPADSAMFFDPNKVESIVEVMQNFINLPKKEVEEMVLTGYKNSKKYTWKKTAEQILDVLTSVN